MISSQRCGSRIVMAEATSNNQNCCGQLVLGSIECIWRAASPVQQFRSRSLVTATIRATTSRKKKLRHAEPGVGADSR
jgi:hypothetical protein